VGTPQACHHVHENDVGGLLDFFMPAPGPSKDSNSVNSLEQFQEIFTVAGPDGTRLTRLDAVPGKLHLQRGLARTHQKSSGHRGAAPVRTGYSPFGGGLTRKPR
jgi:hypothetical protein